MPLVAVVLAGAGAGAALYAGFTVVAREVMRQTAELEREMQRRRASAQSSPEKDLGRLEWDEHAGVYRPVKRG